MNLMNIFIIIQVANYSHSTRLLAATTLRNVLGTRNLSELLTEREAISHTMQTSLDIATDPWGVQVERVEMCVQYSEIALLFDIKVINVFLSTLSDIQILSLFG